MRGVVIDIEKLDHEISEIDEQIEMLQARRSELEKSRDFVLQYQTGTRNRSAKRAQSAGRRQTRARRTPTARRTRTAPTRAAGRKPTGRRTRAAPTRTAGRKTSSTAKAAATAIARKKRGESLTRNSEDQQTRFAMALLQNYKPGEVMTAREAKNRLPKNVQMPGFSNYFHRETVANNGILEKIGHGQFKLRDDANARLQVAQ